MWGLAWYLDRFESLAILEPVTTWVLVLGWFWTYQEQVAWSFGEYGTWMGLEAIIRYWPRVLDCGSCPELDFTGISSVWVSKTRLLVVFGGLMDVVIQNGPFCMSSVCLLTLYSRYWSLPPAFLSVNTSGFVEGKTHDRKLHSVILMTSEFSRFCSHLFCFGFCLLLLYVSIFGCFYVFVEFWILILWILYSLILWILYYVAPEFSFNIF